MLGLVVAAALGVGGSDLVDIVAWIYTLLVGGIFLSKVLQERNAVPPAPAEEEVHVEISSGCGAASTVRPLSNLEEPGTGKQVPATLCLASPGGSAPIEMVSLACGPRIKKVAMMNIKVYALALYVERSERARKALEPFKGKAEAPLLAAALLDATDPSKFFPRALHMVFARGVSGKQVSDALAEKLKAAVPAEVFKRFSDTLLAAVGPSGLAENETLTFLWYQPAALRIYVRGKPGGGADLQDSTLPRVLHGGVALGADPSVPEIKAGLAKGLARLYHGVGGDGGGGANPRRAGTVSKPRFAKEPATGLSLPTELSLEAPKGGAPVSLSLLSCGVKVKKLGFVAIQVYAVGIFAEPNGFKAHLKPEACGNGGSQLFEGLLSKEAFFPRALHMVFARGVTAKQVGDSLAEKLKQAVAPDAFERFSSTLLAGIGSSLDKGEALSYLWGEPESLTIFVRGKAVGVIEDVKLPRVMFVGFLGDDPGSPEAKAGVPKGGAALF